MDTKEDINTINNDIKNTSNNSIPQDTRKRIVKYLSSRSASGLSSSDTSSSGDWCNYNEDDDLLDKMHDILLKSMFEMWNQLKKKDPKTTLIDFPKVENQFKSKFKNILNGNNFKNCEDFFREYNVK